MTELIHSMVRAGRELAELGLSPGSSGNASVRVGPEMFISPTGVSMSRLAPDSLSRISLDASNWGEHVGGPAPSKEFPLHLAMYAREPEAVSVIHLHSFSSVACSCLPAWASWSALPPLTPYFVMRVGQTPLIDYAPPGDPRQAASVQELPIAFQGVLLQNHGQLTVGKTVEQAQERAIEIEETARLRVVLYEQSDVRLLEEEEVFALSDKYGTPWGGR